MPASTYWSRLLTNRLSRRRALATTAGAAAAATLLAACGGPEDANEDVSGILQPVEDTSKQAKRGGIIQLIRPADPPTWDPMILSSQWQQMISHLFGRLTILKPGYMEDSDGEVIGNHAESWEFSPDGLTLTFKLKPNIAFHNIPPVNGRIVDVDDVIFSAKRLFAQGTARGTYSNAVNPSAPIQSITATDSRTIVMKLAFPMVTLPSLLAYDYGGYFHILPKEADGGFDLKTLPIGSGPWFLKEHIPSARFSLRRHPGYYDKELPYLEGIDFAILAEYATQLAQFKNGSLHFGSYHGWAVRPEDILLTKQDVPDLVLRQGDLNLQGNSVFFGWRAGGKNPYTDVRVRQAYSMALDRDLFIDVDLNVSNYENAGIPVETRWNSAIPANYFTGWWLDPRGKDFGPNAVYYQHNIAEAKKLMAAAGYSNGVDVIRTSAPDNYGAKASKDMEVICAMAAEIGFRYTDNIVGYNTGYQPQYRDASGNFDGETHRSVLGGATDAVELLLSGFSTAGGSTFVGLDVNGRGDFSGDPYIDSQLKAARAEVDIAKRRSTVHELQRYLGKQQYLLRYPGAATGLLIDWPGVKNHRVWRGPNFSFWGSGHYIWLDKTLPPFNRT